MTRKAIGFFVLTALLTLPVFAEKVAMPPLDMPTAASNGFGGAHVAYTDNVFSLFVNPAAMVQVQQRSFFTLAPSLMSPQTTVGLTNSIIDLAQGSTEALGKMADTLSKQKGKIALGMELREFPLSFAWVANGFGFGLWNRTFVNANIVGTNLEANVYSDVMLPVGFAFKILNVDNQSLDAGVTLKPFARVRAYEQQTITSLIGNNSDFIDNVNVPVILGGGVDAGLMYRWGNWFRAGFTFNDIYTRGKVVYNINGEDNNTYYVPFTMNGGVAFDFKLLFLKFTLAADWRDIGNAFHQDDYLRRNYLLDLGAGLQVSIFDIINLRVGMSEMLPSCGVGFDLGPVKIDLAYYGREYGLEPGQLSTAIVELSFSIRPGAQKRDWPWTKRSVVGLFTGVEKVSSGSSGK